MLREPAKGRQRKDDSPMTMEPPYPRDMKGYGREPPHADWPGGARIAVQFVVNYEEGGENCILHGDAASEAFLSEIVGAQPWPEQRHMTTAPFSEYAARAAFWRLWRMFTERNCPVTVFGVASALARSPEQTAAMREAGWEIASHGLKWIDYKEFTREDEAAHMREAIRIHTEVTGERPLGWYTGRSALNTLPLVMEEGGFVYSADSYADDLPYWVKGPKGPHLIVPYTVQLHQQRRQHCLRRAPVAAARRKALPDRHQPQWSGGRNRLV
jgi:peptidoglycan/xylan/chitin deacetylase (PgdA/CDA1 family)